MGKADFVIRFLQSGPVTVGSRLQGTLSAVVDQEIKGTSLVLQFVGQESTRVKYTTTHRNGKTTTTTTHYANASRNLFAADLSTADCVKIVNDNGRVPPGMYEVPFEVDLPESLPSTMTESYNDGYCKIVYQVKVELKGSGVLWNYKCEREIGVIAMPLETVPIPYSAPPVTENVSFLCCFNRGSMVFGAKVNDTRLDRGETSPVSLSCCNNTTVVVKRIEATLMQECRWEAFGHRELTTQVLQRITFPSFDSESTRKLLAPRQSLDRNALGGTQRDLVFRDIESGKHTGTVTMPLRAHCSYAGSLMSIQHYILVEVHTGCCVNNPQIRIPVQAGETRSGGSQPSTVVPAVNMDEAIEYPQQAVVLGGKPVSWEGEEEPDIVFPSQPFEELPSLTLLLEQMEDSVSDLDIVQAKVADEAWKSVFQSLTPTDFGAIVKRVNSDFDQPKVAVAVAAAVRQFSCAHVVAGLRTTATWNRGALTEKLVPFCHDLVKNQSLILSELDDWEKLTTERAFAGALKEAAKRG